MESEEKKESIEVEKEYYTKNEVNDLLNSKFASMFGDLIKEINKPRKEEKNEEVKKEPTIDELRF